MGGSGVRRTTLPSAKSWVVRRATLLGGLVSGARHAAPLMAVLLVACQPSPTVPATAGPSPSTSHALASHTPIAVGSEPAASHGVGGSGHATALLAGWPMFHADESHTGAIAGRGRIPAAGPTILASYRLFDALATEDDLTRLRWTSTLPLADLNGDGRLEIVVTTPDVAAPTLPRLNGEPVPNMVQALAYVPGEASLRVLWSYRLASAPGEAGIDTYSPALADADGDGLPDVIFTARDGAVRALKGTTGTLIWQFDMGRITEAGPMLGDVDGDGVPEVVVVTDCRGGTVRCTSDGPAALFVLPLRASGTNRPAWQLTYPWKMDSAEPVFATVHGVGKVILAGTWGGELLGVWRTGSGDPRTASIRLRDIEPTIPGDSPPVIRTSPLVDAAGDAPLAIFGWLPSDLNATDGRLTAVRLRSDNGALVLEHAWTRRDLDTWKSSPALIPGQGGTNLIVAGYGLGIGPPPTQSGTVGGCDSRYVFGGVVAVDEAGTIKWKQDFGNAEGNLRASAAVADMNGDGRLDVILPAGCYGKVHAFDGQSGQSQWTLQLGPRTQTSPSIGDLDGDGALEIVIASYDGKVYVLGAP